MPSSTSKGMPTAMEMRRELRGAVRCLTERGITKAAKWAAEQLCGLPDNLDGSENDEGHELGLLGREEPPASDRYLLAKTYFDLREYKRAASTLEHECDAKSTFLRCYAKYLAGERAREEQRGHAGIPGAPDPGGAAAISLSQRNGRERGRHRRPPQRA